jgi:hypothetical protein
LGVVVIEPKVGEARSTSTGPNEVAEEGDRAADRLLRARRREAHLGANVVRAGADGAHELGAAALDAAVERL